MSQCCVISDPFRFVAEQRELSGRLPVSALGRLLDLLAATEGELSWRVAGVSAQRGEPMLSVEVQGVLSLQCQRCLATLVFPLNVASTLKLVRREEEIPDEELEVDEYDAIAAQADLDVLALIEDEVLLAVPAAPRHDVCNVPLPVGGAKKESSFAALATLQKRGET